MNTHPPLPLHRLFIQLENSGIFVGTAERLRVQQLLAESGAAWRTSEGREALMYEIAPLLCRNRVEQEVFYKVFGDFLRGLGEPMLVSPLPPGFWEKWGRWLLVFSGTAILAVAVWYICINLEDTVEVKLEEVAGKDQFLPHETAVFKNTTDLKAAANTNFVWKIYSDEVDKNGNPILEKTDSSETLRMEIARLKSRRSFQVYLEAYGKRSRDTIGRNFQNIEIHCAAKPEVKDTVIRTKGNFQLGQAIQFFAPMDLDKNWLLEWDFGDGIKNTKLIQNHVIDIWTTKNPEHTYATKGTYLVSLTITDTTQRGQCSTILEKQIQIQEDIPTLQPQPLQKDELKPTWAYSPLTWLLAAAALIAALFFFWKWYHRPSVTEPLPEPKISPNLRRAFEPKDRSPYAIPYRSNNAQIRLAAEQMEFANTLRRRQEGQQTSLHISKTIGATIEKLGYTELRFAQNTRPTHYLFLIDLQSGASHQAQLFQYLVEMLVGQEVLADVFFYKHNFERFWNPLHPEGLSLSQLAMHYGDRRLAIFGDGDRLMSDAPEDEPLHKGWSDGLKRWPQRMFVTPVPVASWTFREARLYRICAVFQADLGGLMQAARFVDAGMDDENLPPTFREWQEKCFRSRIDADTERTWRTPADHRAYLREARSEEPLYRWLRALATYPDLNWNVTIAIGRALGIEPRYEHLLVLARIPWLQEGTMKPSLWRAFWQELPKDDECRAREAIRTELQAIEAKAAEGWADQKVQIRLAVQDFALRPQEAEAQDALRFVLENITPSPQLGEELDLVVARHVPDFKPVVGAAGGTAKAFLKQENEIKQPFATPMFWAWYALLILTLAILGQLLFAPADRWVAFFEEKEMGLWFVEQREGVVDEAMRLNNLAVDAWNDPEFEFDKYPQIPVGVRTSFAENFKIKSGATSLLTSDTAFWLTYQDGVVMSSLDKKQYFAVQLYYSIQLFTQALESRPKYELADANIARSFYNIGIRSWNEQKNAFVAIKHFKVAYFHDSLRIASAEAIAQIYYKNNQIDSACHWIKKVVEARPDYFNWLAAKGVCGQDTFALRLLILDEATRRPIAQAELRANDLPALKSDGNGRISFIFQPRSVPSQVRVSISQKGYTSFSRTLTPSSIGHIDTIRLAASIMVTPCRKVANVKRSVGFRNRILTLSELNRLDKNPNDPVGEQTLIEAIPLGQEVVLIDSSRHFWKIRYKNKVGFVAKTFHEKPTLVPCYDWTVPNGSGIPFVTSSTPQVSIKDTNKYTLIFSNDNTALIPTMIKIPGGTFSMGCTNEQQDCDKDEKPTRQVTVSTFWMANTELTFEEYDAFCDATKRDKPDDRGWGRGKRPVINVSWKDAVAYCNWRSAQENRMPCYTISGSTTTCNWRANGYRLPTEAEWEYAARGGGKAVIFGNGRNTIDPKEINFDSRVEYKKNYSVVGEYRGKTVPAGSLNSPNPLGLHDMSGNVHEWCWDWLQTYPFTSQIDPKGYDNGSYSVLRGGSWKSPPLRCRVSYRDRNTPGYRHFGVGFRLCLSSL